jgi:hypothetical protein
VIYQHSLGYLIASAPEAVPESVCGIGVWRDWPWTLLDRAPEATRAAWDIPAVFVWQLELG